MKELKETEYLAYEDDILSTLRDNKDKIKKEYDFLHLFDWIVKSHFFSIYQKLYDKIHQSWINKRAQYDIFFKNYE